MFTVDLKNRTPIYEQVIHNLKHLIITGVLKEDEKAPSVRELAKLLSVNPNTVQKAYRELETHGYLYTVIGQGSFIAKLPEAAHREEVNALFEKMRPYICELLIRGVTHHEIIDFIKNIKGDTNRGQH